MPARRMRSCATAQGDEHDGYSVTGMFYHQLWTNTTDIPLRAIDEGVVPNRFGTLEPDRRRPRAAREPLGAVSRQPLGAGQFTASAYFIYNQLHLYNDFTHYLVDPVHGDQEDQFENRRVVGGAARLHAAAAARAPSQNELSRRRADALRLAAASGACRARTRVPLPAADDPPSFSNYDQVYLFAGRPTCRRPRTGPPAFAPCSACAMTISTAPTSTISRRCTRRPATPTAARQPSRCCSPRASLIYTASPTARVLPERRARDFTAPTCAA